MALIVQIYCIARYGVMWLFQKQRYLLTPTHVRTRFGFPLLIKFCGEDLSIPRHGLIGCDTY
jgi:hypothetical protein